MFAKKKQTRGPPHNWKKEEERISILRASRPKYAKDWGKIRKMAMAEIEDRFVVPLHLKVG